MRKASKRNISSVVQIVKVARGTGGYTLKLRLRGTAAAGLDSADWDAKQRVLERVVASIGFPGEVSSFGILPERDYTRWQYTVTLYVVTEA